MRGIAAEPFGLAHPFAGLRAVIRSHGFLPSGLDMSVDTLNMRAYTHIVKPLRRRHACLPCNAFPPVQLSGATPGRPSRHSVLRPVPGPYRVTHDAIFYPGKVEAARADDHQRACPRAGDGSHDSR